jgi:hypothetical protein
MKLKLIQEVQVLSEATLTPAQLTKYFTPSVKDKDRLNTFTDKMKKGDKFELVGGGTVTLKKDADLIKKIQNMKPGDAFPKVQLQSKDGEKIPFNKLKKTTEFGGGGKAAASGKIANKGDVAEGVLGAALATRFALRPPKNISEKDVEKMINSLTPGKDKTIAVNDKHKNKDKIVLRIVLSERNMNDLLDKSKRDQIQDLISSATKYVNSKRVKDHAELFYLNDNQNKIEVNSDGLSDQKGSKADIKVIVDDEVVRLNISLKAGAVKQFGQVSGQGFDKQVILWDKLINENVDAKQYLFDRDMKKDGPFYAIEKIYKRVVTLINKRLKGDNDKKEFHFIKDLGKGIDYFATRNEKGMTLVHMHKGDFEELSFKSMHLKLKKIDLAAKMKPNVKNPEVLIYDKNSDKILLHIRVKIETGHKKGPYIRNIIEKGPLLVDLLKLKSKGNPLIFHRKYNYGWKKK